MRQPRKVLWVILRSLFFKESQDRMAGEATDLCLRMLKESDKSRFHSCKGGNSVLIISHITFRNCHVHIFPTTLLEIAVYKILFAPRVFRIIHLACPPKFTLALSLLFLEGLIFGGAYLRREICVSKSNELPFYLRVNLPFLLCFTLYLRAIFQVQAPGGHIFGGAI